MGNNSSVSQRSYKYTLRKESDRKKDNMKIYRTTIMKTTNLRKRIRIVYVSIKLCQMFLFLQEASVDLMVDVTFIAWT